MLRGATGSVAVSVVPVETLEVGDLLMEPNHLPIIPDALGGAEGMLGTDGLANKRIHIDFRRDSISIMRSRNERATSGFATIPVKFLRGRLLIVDAYLGGVPVKAVIDTGGQATLGNEALRIALAEHRRKYNVVTPDEVTGATLDVQMGNRVSTPSLAMGEILVRNAAMTFADFAIFEHWKLTKEPAMLIGMDVHWLARYADYRLPAQGASGEAAPELNQAARRVSIGIARDSASRRRFVTMRSWSSQIMSLPRVAQTPGMSACTRQMIPPQIMRKPKPVALARCSK